jgi:phage replication-related protein YjqB (UPF0714/DUF867 family)
MSDFRIISLPRKSSVLVMAPHGGLIEPGTSLIAKKIASKTYSFYAFEGLKKKNNWSLHVTSTQYDEPTALAMVKRAVTVVTIHGCREKSKFVCVGGLDSLLVEKISHLLNQNGFIVNPENERKFPAINPLNICNRGQSGKGVQLEISEGLRDELVIDKQKLSLFSKLIYDSIEKFVDKTISAIIFTH